MKRTSATDSHRVRLSKNLLAIRGEKGIKQDKLAAAAGISQTYYSQVERGTRNVSIDALHSISEALQVDIVDLLRPVE